MDAKIAFVGGGNMASALIGGLIGNGFPAASLAAVELLASRREHLARHFGIKVSARVADVVGEADTLVLAVKPQQMHAVAEELKALVRDQLIVTIAAGIRTSDLARWLGGYGRIVRVMPNTPALVRAGVSGMYARPEVNAAERARAQTILCAVGDALWVEREELIDAVTAVSGSGPAYVFYFIEAVRKAALEMGIAPQDAQRLVMGTFEGAVRLAQASDEDVSVLRERVTSKGGTTERALASMEADRVGTALTRAVHAALQRAGELGDELGKAR
ncbi:MAG: pyrroline-5-carboxylate reductase [Burkholderiales bacterium]|nr:pyrroline-5-carboxylate reductase [Burkholderiales bacterium]